MSFRTAATPTEEKPGKSRLSEVLFAGLNNGGALKSAPQSFVKKNVPTVDLQAGSPDLTRMFLQQQKEAGMGRSASPMLKRPKKKTNQASIGVNGGESPFGVELPKPTKWGIVKLSKKVLVSTDEDFQRHTEATNRMLVDSAKSIQDAMESAGRNAASNRILAAKLRHAALLAQEAGGSLGAGVLKRQAGLLEGLRKGRSIAQQENEWYYDTFGESALSTVKEIEMAEILVTVANRLPKLPLMGSNLMPHPFYYTEMGPLYLSILECVDRMTCRIMAKFEELALNPVTDAVHVDAKIVHYLTVPTIAMQAGKVKIKVHTDPELAKSALKLTETMPRMTSGLRWSLAFKSGSREHGAAQEALRLVEGPLKIDISTTTLSTALNGVWGAMSAEEKRAAEAWKLSPPVVVPHMYSFRVSSAVRG